MFQCPYSQNDEDMSRLEEDEDLGYDDVIDYFDDLDDTHSSKDLGDIDDIEASGQMGHNVGFDDIIGMDGVIFDDDTQYETDSMVNDFELDHEDEVMDDHDEIDEMKLLFWLI